MNKLGYKQFSERRRPHLHPVGATLFVTFRLAGSIPASIVRHYQKRHPHVCEEFRRQHPQLFRPSSTSGPIVLDDCFSVMSNHVHVVFKPFLSEADLHHELNEDGHSAFVSERPGLSRIMHSMKGRSARECNLILSRQGQFWEHESFDHVIRDGKFSATIKYVLSNPVKAGLVGVWRDWRWNYCRADIADKFWISDRRSKSNHATN